MGERVGMKKLILLLCLLPSLAWAGQTPPPGTNNQIIINKSGLWGATSSLPSSTDVTNSTVLAPSTATTPVSLLSKFKQVTDVTAYGAVGDGSTNNYTSVMSAITHNQNAVIVFPLNGSNNYEINGPLLMTDTSGHNFQGDIYCTPGVTITFTNAGNSTDAEASIQNGFQFYPQTNGTGGDTTGWNNSVANGGHIFNCNIVPPAHGAGVHTGNSIGVDLENVTFSQGAAVYRYGYLGETNIDPVLNKVSCSGFTNACGYAGMTGNSNIYYGSSPSSTYWNDNWKVTNMHCYNNSIAGALSCFLDAGSQSERIRSIEHMDCYTGSTSDLQYCYVGRNVAAVVDTNWTENVNYPVRLIASNSNEGGGTTHLTGVTGAEPSGYWQINNFPDGFSYVFEAKNNFFQAAKVELDVSGVTSGSVTLGPNTSNACSGGYNIQTNQGGTVIIDYKTAIQSGSCTYKNINYSSYVDYTGRTSETF